MPTTFSQRQTEAETLMRSGKGLVAVALADRDIILVKDPSFHAPANATDVVVWKEYAGGSTLAAYGL